MTPRRPQVDSRIHARAPYRETVRYFDWDRARSGQATQISASGIFVCTPAPLAEGRMVTLRLALPGNVAGFTVLARVVRTVQGGLLHEAGMGLQFLDIPSQARGQIEQYVSGRRAA
ncbi:MAG: PilZ domain-containing protein [Deltaproteobacteria bacterium]|nr:PilZ domain-containing protein [Deltaproteobacteria bacterium]